VGIPAIAAMSILRAAGVHQQFGDTVNVIVPMGYPANNDAYIDEVRQAGLALFSAENLQISAISWNLMIILRCCANAIWAISSLPASRDRHAVFADSGGYPCVLNRENPFWQDMAEQHLPVLFTTMRSMKRGT
jgi:dTDP-N-acetylfucosamine:lipid II N-acetylfucosaminyltransferase